MEIEGAVWVTRSVGEVQTNGVTGRAAGRGGWGRRAWGCPGRSGVGQRPHGLIDLEWRGHGSGSLRRKASVGRRALEDLDASQDPLLAVRAEA